MRVPALVLAISLTLAAAPALGQDVTPAVELSAGVTTLNADGASYLGWGGSLAVSLARWMSLAVDGGSNHGDSSRVSLAVAVGPRFVTRHRRFSAFAHGLVGVDQRFGHNSLLLQPGGGVDLWLSRRFGLRVGLDAWWTWYDGEDEGATRWYAGGVVALGSR